MTYWTLLRESGNCVLIAEDDFYEREAPNVGDEWLVQEQTFIVEQIGDLKMAGRTILGQEIFVRRTLPNPPSAP